MARRPVDSSAQNAIAPELPYEYSLALGKDAGTDESPAVAVRPVGCEQAEHGAQVSDTAVLASRPRAPASVDYPHVVLVRGRNAAESTGAFVEEVLSVI